MAGKQKQALGKGLGSLIPNGMNGLDAAMGLPGTPHDEDGARVLKVAVDLIEPSPFQPRFSFTEEQLAELMGSIREHGIIQPLIVRQVKDRFELIAGERRWRASKELGLKKVPVILRKASDKEVLEWALVENLQREGLNPIEEARGYSRLAKEFNLRQDEIAERVGKSRSSVANAIRLLDLQVDVQGMLAQGTLSVGHAKAILSLKKKDQQLLLAEEVVRKAMTVRQTERVVKNPQTLLGKQDKAPTPPADKAKTPSLPALEDCLSDLFKTKVTALPASVAQKGRLEFHYASEDELVRILELLGIDTEDARYLARVREK